MKTKGGFEIQNFNTLEFPVGKGNVSEPHIYGGNIINMPQGDKIIKNQYCTWDKFGRCSNWKREDCFIEIKTI